MICYTDLVIGELLFELIGLICIKWLDNGIDCDVYFIPILSCVYKYQSYKYKF